MVVSPARVWVGGFVGDRWPGGLRIFWGRGDPRAAARGYRLSSACGGLSRRIRWLRRVVGGSSCFQCSIVEPGRGIRESAGFHPGARVGPGPDLRDIVRHSWGGARYSSPDSIARPDAG